MPDRSFSLESARSAAEHDEIARWVGDFLASSGSDNEMLAAALAQERHWWVGPLRFPLDRLERMAGPEDDVECPVDDDEWEDDIDGMEDSLDDGWEPPPLLVQCADDQLLLQDGNHRYEAMTRAGESSGWVLVYFPDEAGRDRFVASEPAAAGAPTCG